MRRTNRRNVVIVGASDSGKSALLQRLAKEGFTNSYIGTTGVDNKKITHNNIKYCLFDLASNDTFKNLNNARRQPSVWQAWCCCWPNPKREYLPLNNKNDSANPPSYTNGG